MKFSALLTPLTRIAALCLLTVAAQASEQSQHLQLRAQERAEIAQQRQEISARTTQAEEACWQRFAVEDCLRKARAQQRSEMSLLRDRELRINNEERQEKASERLRSIERQQQQKSPNQTHVQGLPGMAPPTQPVANTAPLEGTPAKTPADIARELGQRQTEAQRRAAEQAQRLRNHDAEMAERTQSEAQRRNRIQKNLQEKQEAAQARQKSKADDIAQRKGAPLPIPQGLPVPKP